MECFVIRPDLCPGSLSYLLAKAHKKRAQLNAAEGPWKGKLPDVSNAPKAAALRSIDTLGGCAQCDPDDAEVEVPNTIHVDDDIGNMDVARRINDPNIETVRLERVASVTGAVDSATRGHLDCDSMASKTVSFDKASFVPDSLIAVNGEMVETADGSLLSATHVGTLGRWALDKTNVWRKLLIPGAWYVPNLAMNLLGARRALVQGARLARAVLRGHGGVRRRRQRVPHRGPQPVVHAHGALLSDPTPDAERAAGAKAASDDDDDDVIGGVIFDVLEVRPTPPRKLVLREVTFSPIGVA